MKVRHYLLESPVQWIAEQRIRKINKDPDNNAERRKLRAFETPEHL